VSPIGETLRGLRAVQLTVAVPTVAALGELRLEKLPPAMQAISMTPVHAPLEKRCLIPFPCPDGHQHKNAVCFADM